MKNTGMTLSEFLRLSPRGDLWVFGYGSLMWSPGFRYREKAPAFAHGYHRSLCVYSHRYRGTPQRPGLVMGLCRGGSCWGIAFRVGRQSARRVLINLWYREMRNRVYVPRFVWVRLPRGRKVRALAFLSDVNHAHFAGDLDPGTTARLVAQGEGKRGANLDYLSATLAHMHQIGVRDPHLDHVLLAALHSRRSASRKRSR
jgi:glutathione-specific gamma-glutamylcyclotransferase